MGFFSSILKVGGGIVGGLVGGPAGAKVGSALGGAAGGLLSGGSGQSQAAAVLAGQQQTDAARRAEALTREQITLGRTILQPFAPTGGVSQSFGLQQAFSGALGPEAQAQAFNEFQFDPGVEFLRKQGTENINRTAAAFGGIGGGNRLKRLSEFNQGLAQQSLSNRINQLQAVTQTQFGAAGQQAQIGVQLAGGLAAGAVGAGAGQAAGTVGAESARLSGQAATNQLLGEASNLLGGLVPQLFGSSGSTAGTGTGTGTGTSSSLTSGINFNPGAVPIPTLNLGTSLSSIFGG